MAGAMAGVEGTPLQLNGASSSDPDAGDVLTYSWDFGDGTTDVGATPTHVYLDNGAYTVRLTVTDRYGLSSTTTAGVVVANATPVPQLASASGSLTATSGIPFGVAGSFTDAGVNDAPWSYTINWGDGNAPTGQTNDMQFLLRATNVYRRAGTYSVSFAVTDKDGATGTSTPLTVTVVRQNVPAQALPAVINLNDRGQAGVDVALLSRAGFDPAQVNPGTANIGSVAVDTHGAAQMLSSHYEDLNQDGVPDLVMRFSRAALIDAGALAASSTELVLFADLRDGTQIVGHAAVQTHVIGKAD
jgi:PKD repeat protein